MLKSPIYLAASAQKRIASAQNTDLPHCKCSKTYSKCSKTLIYDRVKTKKSMLMPGETAHFTVACTCVGEHQNLRVVMGVKGIPKEIVGNAACWYNQWFFVREQLEDPNERILRKWAERYVRWSPLRWSEPYIQGSFHRFAKYCHLERAQQIRNTAGRKTCVSIGLGDMQLPAAKLPA